MIQSIHALATALCLERVTEHRQAAAGYRREAMQTPDRSKAPGLLAKAAEREQVAKMIEKRVREGTHKLPDR